MIIFWKSLIDGKMSEEDLQKYLNHDIEKAKKIGMVNEPKSSWQKELVLFLIVFDTMKNINDEIIIELKSVDKVLPIHEAQLLTYMKLSGIKIGLLMNFNVCRLKDGIKRFVL